MNTHTTKKLRNWIFLIAFFTFNPLQLLAQVSTLAGNGTSGCTDGTGSGATFGYNYASHCVDASGNMYVAEYSNQIIRKITPTGVVTTIAGICGSIGSTNGTGSAARFFGPLAIEVDASGNLYVAEYSNHAIRKITPGGVVTTFAGTIGSSGNADGTGTSASFTNPWGLAVDGSGNLYVSQANGTIRKITPSAVVTTLAGTPGGYAYADGTGSAARFYNPWGIDCDASGNLYVADYNNNRIRKVNTSTGVVSTFAGSGAFGSTDGTGTAAQFGLPMDVTVASNGNIYVADRSIHLIRQITPAAVVTTLAGLSGSSGFADGTNSAARFNLPSGIEYSTAAGALYVVDQFNYRIRKIIVDQNASLNFDGTNDRVSIPHTSNQVGMSSLTLEAWVYITGSTGNFRNIIMKGNYGYGMAIDFNDKLGYWSNSSYSNCPRTTASIPYNTWTHVAVVVVQGVSTTFYINGVNAGSSTSSMHTTINSGANDPLFLGYQGTGCNCNYFSGSMDEVHVWNTARTGAQILAGMNCSINSATNLIANYNFNNGEPAATNTGKDTLSDVSGNWNKGTLLNFALTGTTSNWAAPAIGHEADVFGNSVAILDGSSTPTTTDSTSFGTVANGSMRRYTIRNNGAAPLNISSITLSGTHASEYQIFSAPTSIAAGASATFYVKFNASVSGSTRSATVNINNNDCDEAVYNFNIQAQATAVAAATLNFDGTSDNVRIAHNATLNPSTAMTLEAWVYRTANNYSTVIAKWDDDNNNRGYMLNFGELGNNSKLCFVATNTGNWLPSPKIQWETNTALNLNQWYHVAVTFTQNGTNNIKYYLNGVLTDQTTWNFSINASNPIDVLIGGYDGPGNGQNAGANSRYFAGNLDEVRIWNRALCQAEIQNNMSCEIPTTSSGLIANYHFNQGVAGGSNSGTTTLTDASGNSFTGTLNSFTLSGTSSNWISPGAVTSGVSCTVYAAPEINLKGNTVSIVDGDITPSSADSTSFGAVSVGAKRRFTIENTGAGSLSISSIVLSGLNASDFSIAAAPTTVNAGSSASFYVLFNPSAAGSKTATITINNSDCDESVYDFAIFASSGAPGGVASGINVWLKGNASAYTDNGSTVATSGQLVQQWNDVSNGLLFRQTNTSNKPTLSNSINYNPAIEFFGNNFIDLTTTLGIGSTQDYTYLAVFLPKTINNGTATDAAGSFIIDRQTNSNNIASLKFSGTNNITHQYQYNNGTGLGANTGATLSTNTAYIAEFHRDYNVEFGIAVNGGTKITSGSNTNDLTPPDLRIGRHATTVNAGFVGELAEIIVYGKYPTTAELNRINSYLAIKYGITLDQSAGQDYISSTGSIIYNAATGGTKDTFDFEITGIGRDDASALDQRQSKSVQPFSMLAIGNGNIAVNNTSNSNSFSSDQSFFIAGHNGRNADNKGVTDFGTSFNATTSSNEPILSRLNRVWSATETGSVGTLKLRFDMSRVYGTSGLNTNDLQFTRLLVDADGIFASGATSISPSTFDITTGIIEFDWNFASGSGFFFTIGSSNSALTPLPVTWLNAQAKWMGNHAHVTWKTAQEEDTYIFKVERSINGSEFSTVGTVATKAVAGNNQMLEYNFTDANIREKVDGTLYYRIRWEENTGKFEYSPLMALNTTKQEQIQVYPNPASSYLIIQGKTVPEGVYSVVLRNMTGAETLNATYTANEQGLITKQISVDSLPRGIYTIEIRSENSYLVEKIILNN